MSIVIDTHANLHMIAEWDPTINLNQIIGKNAIKYYYHPKLPLPTVMGIVNSNSSAPHLNRYEKYTHLTGLRGIFGCAAANANDLNDLNVKLLCGLTYKDFLADIIKSDICYAIGECGIDATKPLVHQYDVLNYQLKLAETARKPIVINSRKDNGKTFEIIKKVLPTTHPIHFHIFDNTIQNYADTFTNSVFSFDGRITYDYVNDAVLKSIKYLPLNRIMIGSNAPKYTPHPYNSSICTPRHISLILEKIADIKTSDVIHAGIVIGNTSAAFYGFDLMPVKNQIKIDLDGEIKVELEEEPE